MLAIALENVKKGAMPAGSMPAFEIIGESGNLFKKEEDQKSISLVNNTRRGLLDSIRTNEAGEAFYDSEKNIMD